MIQEGLEGFVDFGWKLKDQTNTATAEVEVAKELKKAYEARKVKLIKDLQSFLTQNHRLEARVKDLEKKLVTEKASMIELKVKLS